jgi:predicted TIM-barrel fold metal-dependent hydrolase
MVVNMILSGAKRRFPSVKVISTHGGGTIPYLASRLSILEPLFGAGEARPTQTAAQLLEGLGSFYFDLTACCAATSLDSILHLVPPQQLLFGTDFPLMPSREIRPSLERLAAYEALGREGRQAILSNNAVTLLPRLALRVR